MLPFKNSCLIACAPDFVNYEAMSSSVPEEELLARVALAANLLVDFDDVVVHRADKNKRYWCESTGTYWNPCSDNGDAMMLGMLMGMEVAPGCARIPEKSISITKESIDVMDATRLAIVAAAEVAYLSGLL